ncbi:K2C75 protein, partial [Piaya cayana]|nr:K2C75 protein [Piaya cayana]
SSSAVSAAMSVNRSSFSSISMSRSGGGGTGSISSGFGSRSLHNLGGSKRISVSGGYFPTRPEHGYGSGQGGFAYRVGGGGLGFGGGRGPGSIQEVTVNKNLLVPLNLEIDPSVQRVRQEEKEQIKSLNNKFASFIDKVRIPFSSIQPGTFIIACRAGAGDFHTPTGKRVGCTMGAVKTRSSPLPNRYEEEINRRTTAENDFVLLKKDADVAFLNKVELGTKVDALADEINFLRALYEA